MLFALPTLPTTYTYIRIIQGCLLAADTLTRQWVLLTLGPQEICCASIVQEGILAHATCDECFSHRTRQYSLSLLALSPAIPLLITVPGRGGQAVFSTKSSKEVVFHRAELSSPIQSVVLKISHKLQLLFLI